MMIFLFDLLIHDLIKPRKFNCVTPRNFICLAAVIRGIYQIRRGKLWALVIRLDRPIRHGIGRLKQAPCGPRKLKLESTDVIQSSAHSKKLASFLPEFRLWAE